MSSSNQHYDVIIIGSGPGGSTLAHRLANEGKKVLILERGPFLPRGKENWEPQSMGRYFAPEVYQDSRGRTHRPGHVYHVGGKSKVFGASMFRLREKDFTPYNHCDGLSVGWPVSYTEFEPYYKVAEDLYQVHGEQHRDPTEPPRSSPYGYPPMSHEPRIREVYDALTSNGIKVYPAPMGIQINEEQPSRSACVRCNTCDGFPCLVHAKSDAEVCAVRPIWDLPNVTLLTEAKVERLRTDAGGKTVTHVEATVLGEPMIYTADLIVCAAGSINSALLLLRSANAQHPYGLGNRSGLLGRNLMRHTLSAIFAVYPDKPNRTAFQKSIAINDFYWGEPGYDFPMGNIQLMGKSPVESFKGKEAIFAPYSIEETVENSIDWWLTTEDIARSDNRVQWRGEQVVLDYTDSNMEPHRRLLSRWKEILLQIEPHLASASGKKPPGYIEQRMISFGHVVGTCRFGDDPRTSVLNRNCQAHDLDNLYVVDGSFFPSSGAVNPSLTIVANALRVGDHLLNDRF